MSGRRTTVFGLVALSSVGPILSVLVLSLIYRPDSAEYVPESIPDIGNSVELWDIFAEEIPEYMREMAVSLLPIIVFFIFFQIVFRRVQKRMLIRIAVGMVYTYAGLFLFLTGVNVGFMPAGNYLGQVLADNPYKWGDHTHRHDHRILYRACRARSVCPDTSGRGHHFGYHKRGGHGIKSLNRCGGISGTRHGEGADGDIHLLVCDTGVCHCTAPVVSLCRRSLQPLHLTPAVWRRGPMTATFLLPFAIGTCTSVGRKYRYRCIRCGCNGRHDASYYDTDIRTCV